MRKILSLLFCLWIILALAACSGARNELNSGSAQSDTPLSSGEPIKATEQPSVIPTEQPSASPTENATAETRDNETKENSVISINITVGSSTFTATLNDNETAKALVAQFPMTLQMNEHNGLEKYYDLSEDLPAASTERPATIHAGDIMGWSGNTLVLFYETHSNSNGGYVPLGRVDNPSNLASALGSGNVQVTWSLAE
ncbi:hypothetical protein SAMN04487895_1013 [Paenibacillus sophorae]|uniref:Cyclophilin-like domain-containing protein n=1 Tax=Paenibacillus sophorae TaxID=1333845 RepID=A0A1H8F5Y7_9BACL|nr:cyclophilin-like fold protein [Paenibacillus sophorae]QWU13775.1 hypothetical protein KP014_17590 [Paenibacillus sophorae]SEN27115.1 hypothetical protein SAMN04487895_1013 [Paenibacillus sophorae]